MDILPCILQFVQIDFLANLYRMELLIPKHSYHQLTNVDQLDHIIHYLVVEKGFIMDNYSKEKVVFTHSQNNMYDATTYIYYPRLMTVDKFESTFLVFV